MSTSFVDLGLPVSITQALDAQGLTEPFPVQASTIPDVLDGRDVSGKAPTGSGKTLAFGLPMLARVGVAKPNRPRALVLSPTRELAAQIRKELLPYAKAAHRKTFAIFGGVRYGAQIEALRRGVDVLVATPGRLEDLIDQGAIDLRSVDIVAVDEADRMADMGFLPAVKRILDQTSKDRQTLLFSATLDGDVKALIKRYQKNPVTHEAGDVETDALDARHVFWQVEQSDKVKHTADAISAKGRTIVFTRTRHGADRLARQLQKTGVPSMAIHGGRSQNQRNRALRDFSDGKVDALIATDVAARGIHVDEVATVVHYDPPNGHKDYVHRSGRTARAGATGTVVSLVLQKERRSVNRVKKELDINEPTALPLIESLFERGETPTLKPRQLRTDQPKVDTRVPNKQSEDRRQTSRSESSKPKKAKGQTKDPQLSAAGVFVSNLPWSTTDQDLRRIFGKYGTVYAASVKMDRRGRSKGVGLVQMHGADAKKAIHSLDGRKVKGRPIAVRAAR
ncbi:MAG: DEAD/DEAH box helicase [Acidimicrobiia bacterium]